MPIFAQDFVKIWTRPQLLGRQSRKSHQCRIRHDIALGDVVGNTVDLDNVAFAIDSHASQSVTTLFVAVSTKIPAEIRVILQPRLRICPYLILGLDEIRMSLLS
jgi:hypothetical protein